MTFSRIIVVEFFFLISEFVDVGNFCARRDLHRSHSTRAFAHLHDEIMNDAVKIENWDGLDRILVSRKSCIVLHHNYDDVLLF